MKRTAIAYLRPPEARMAADEAALAGRDQLDVLAVVREQRGDGRRLLGRALEPIAAGDASALAVARLGAVAGSLRELVALLDWLAASESDLVALDVGLDTGSPSGRRTVSVLREIERWEQHPEPGRPPRGRPGLAALAPELSERIAAMRARGLSLQAIADALNDDGVPTQRGGSHWRPSSVQTALGYRRPRPPPPGAPPPPPPHPPGRSPAPRPPGREEPRAPHAPRRGGPRP